MLHDLLPLPLLLAVAIPSPVAADDPAATFRALRTVDLRMAAIAYQLTTANAGLCRVRAPTPGWAIHGIGQYAAALRGAARVVFGFETPVAVEGVVPGGRAAAAGIAANDALVAVNGTPVDGGGGEREADSGGRDAVNRLIADFSADRPLRVDLIRSGARRSVTIPPSPGCRSAFEVLLGPKMEASSDGTIVQIGVRFFERYTDAEVAVVVAHELAHVILRHRARLEAAGVQWGMFSEFGRNGRLFRRTEDEADRLGVALLYNAGYDPGSAPRFWRAHGGDVDGGVFRSRTHASSAVRARTLDGEVAAIPRGALPYVPAVLATQDQPLQ